MLEISGDLDKLVAKAVEKHGQTKAEIMNDLTTLITPPEKTVAGSNGSKQYQPQEGFKKDVFVKEGSEKEETTSKKR